MHKHQPVASSLWRDGGMLHKCHQVTPFGDGLWATCAQLQPYFPVLGSGTSMAPQPKEDVGIAAFLYNWVPIIFMQCRRDPYL